MTQKYGAHKIFVYGTLMRGHRNHAMMEGARFLGAAYTTSAAYSLVEFASKSAPGHFTPGLLADGKHMVHGELYVVNDHLLDVLDDFEDEGTEYKRVSVDLMGGERAWTYIFIGQREFVAKPKFIELSGMPKAQRWLPEVLSKKKVA